MDFFPSAFIAAASSNRPIRIRRHSPSLSAVSRNIQYGVIAKGFSQYIYSDVYETVEAGGVIL